jgi:hypothetical protein
MDGHWGGPEVKEKTMAKFLLVYQGGGGMAATPEAQATEMRAWNGWFERMGSAVLDIGNPTAAVRRIDPGGAVSADASGPSGYSLIAASGIEEAVALAKDCPVLKVGGSVQVAETIDM